MEGEKLINEVHILIQNELDRLGTRPAAVVPGLLRAQMFIEDVKKRNSRKKF